MYPDVLARQRLGENFTSATNTHATIQKLLNDSFFMPVLFVSKEGVKLVLP
jgi:hypothetical protein